MGTRVLVVDDDEGIRETLAVLFTEAGYTVAEARNGEEALANLRAGTQRSVVLLDFRMPRMDGPAVMRVVATEPALRAGHAFILVTAKNQEQIEPPLAELLAELDIPVVTKPFEMDELLALVAHVAQRLSV